MSSSILIVLLSLVGTSLAIMRGEVVDNIQYCPWQGSLHDRHGSFVCGAILIDEDMALTAASCVIGSVYDVRFGSLKKSEGIHRLVQEVIIHENYNGSHGFYRFNDIALLKFPAVQLGPTIAKIKLGDTEEAGNTKCFITGWGYTTYPGSHQDEIQTAKVEIATNSVGDNGWPQINENHVCTNYGTSQPGTCRGDTGGPLVCLKGDHYELVGISSWQDTYCHTIFSSVFTRVSKFKSWVLDKILGY